MAHARERESEAKPMKQKKLEFEVCRWDIAYSIRKKILAMRLREIAAEKAKQTEKIKN